LAGMTIFKLFVVTPTMTVISYGPMGWTKLSNAEESVPEEI